MPNQPKNKYGWFITPFYALFYENSIVYSSFYNIAGQYAAIDSATWFLITNKTPEEMRSFISWYETEFERRNQIDTLFIMCELNPSYDYHYDYDKISINGFDDSDEESLEDEWLSLN